MRVQYQFSSRKTKRATKSPKMRKQREKYPSIAKKIIEMSDIILEVLDARYIQDTRNLELEEKIKKQGKKIIYVLNKSDLIEKTKKEKTKERYPHIFISCSKRTNVAKLRDLIKKESKQSPSEDKILVGVIGYPNTGKSSLINILIGKASAKTGAEAGFTKGFQKIKLTPNIALLDTPGVIPEKKYSSIEKEKIAQHTIVGGRSYSQVKDPEFVIAQIIKDYKGVLEEHYKINAKGNSEIFLEELGKKLNFLKKGKRVNVDKTSRKIIKDWQAGIIKV